MVENGRVYGKKGSDRLPNGMRDLTKLPRIILGTVPSVEIPLSSGPLLGGHDVPDSEKTRAGEIGTLIDEHGRIVSVQNPDKPLKLD